MSLIGWIILFSILGGVLSVLAASAFLILPGRLRDRLIPHLVSFAVGALLGAALLALLPHAVGHAAAPDVHHLMLTVLVGLLIFFLLEKMVLWRHCHSAHCEAHAPDAAFTHGQQQARIGFVLFGDGLHNFVDGVLIAAAFMTDIDLGIVTALAVAAHEIPQEVGDFAILLHSGLGRFKALMFNLLTSLTTVVGALAAYYTIAGSARLQPYILAVAASSFLYIAVADLIPDMHRHTQLRSTIQQVGLILLGVTLIFIAHSVLH